MTELHERLRCFGFWGCGTGFALVAELHNIAHEHCEAVCPMREACHDAHHERTRSMLLRDKPEFHDAPESLVQGLIDALCGPLRLNNFMDGVHLAGFGTPLWRDADTVTARLPNVGDA